MPPPRHTAHRPGTPHAIPAHHAPSRHTAHRPGIRHTTPAHRTPAWHAMRHPGTPHASPTHHMPSRHTARQPGTLHRCRTRDAGSSRAEAGPAAAAPSAAALTNRLTVCHRLNLAPALSARLINPIPAPEPPEAAAFQIGTCHRHEVPPLLSVTRPRCRGRAAARRGGPRGPPHLRGGGGSRGQPGGQRGQGPAGPRLCAIHGMGDLRLVGNALPGAAALLPPP